MERPVLHKHIDELLDKMGFKDNVSISWGSLAFEIKFEKGEEVLIVKERETRKRVSVGK